MLFFAIFLLIYGFLLLVSAFLKVEIIIKLTKMKLGKNMSDERAVTILYVVGAIALFVSIVLFVIQ